MLKFSGYTLICLNEKYSAGKLQVVQYLSCTNSGTTTLSPQCINFNLLATDNIPKLNRHGC